MLRLGPEGAGRPAILTLPPPFAGSAHYGLDAEGERSWTGTLRVNLPGAGAVSLAGPGFVAALCHGDTLEETLSCGRSVAVEIGRGPR